MKYSPPLDGIRALAVLAVLVYHAFPGVLSGGFTGVDVFFVLSGYLIASVILYDLRAGRFTMREFYLRRIQRLLPNAATTILVTVVVAAALLVPSEAVGAAKNGLFALLNLSNIYIWRTIGGYWGETGEQYAPFLHTWSLAVEEQFYLFFPSVLLLLSRLNPLRSRIAASLAVLTVASLGLCLWAVGPHRSAAFYLLPTRAWEPLLGALIAAVRVPAFAGAPVRPFCPSRLANLAGWAGTAAIVAAAALLDGSQPYPGLNALLPTLGVAAVILAVAEGEGSLARTLSLRPLVLVGQMSYSLYLWHWPGIVLGRTLAGYRGFSRREGELLGAGLGVLAAVVAYYLVEQPLRRRGQGRQRRLIGIGLCFSTAVAASLLLAIRSAPIDSRHLFERPVFDVANYSTTSDGRTGRLARHRSYADVIEPPSKPREADSWRTGGVIRTWGGATPRVVVLGSSHALMYGRVIDDVCRRMGLTVSFLSADGKSPWFGSRDAHAGTREFDEARRRWLRAWRPDVVLVSEKWDRIESLALARNLHALAVEVQAASPHLVLIGQPPVLRVGQNVNLREFVAWEFERGGVLPRIGEDDGAQRRRDDVATLHGFARSRPGLEFVRVDDLFRLADGSVRYADGRQFLYADDDHLSQAGAVRVQNRIASAISRACGAD